MTSETRREALVFVGVIGALLLIGWKLFGTKARPTVISYPSSPPNLTANSSTPAIPDAGTLSGKTRIGPLTLAPLPLSARGDAAFVNGLLDVQMWKFAVKSKRPHDAVTCELQLREKGKPAKTLSTALFGPGFVDSRTGRALLYVGWRPVDARGKSLKLTVGNDGSTSSATVPNPFGGYNSNGSAQSPFPGPRDAVVLQELGFDHPNRKLFVVLKIISKPAAKGSG